MLPVLFHIGALPVKTYGLMMAIAFIVGIWIARARARSRGVEPDAIIDLAVFVIVISIIGARAAYVYVHWEHFQQDPMGVFRIWEGGLAQYGGFVAGTITGLLFFRWRGIDPWVGADVVTPSLAAGVAIGRLGCFMNGCCFGKTCDLPWAVTFRPDSVAGLQFPGAHLHPTQIYEALAAVAIFFVLIAVDRRRRFDGFLLWFFIILLSVYRFLIDPIRHYESVSIAYRGDSLILTNNQAVGIALVVTAVGFMLYLSRRAKRKSPLGS